MVIYFTIDILSLLSPASRFDIFVCLGAGGLWIMMRGSRHNMQTAVHWAALNTLDVQPDEWPTNVENYNLYCDLRSFGIPKDENVASSFIEDTSKINSPEACTFFKKFTALGV